MLTGVTSVAGAQDQIRLCSICDGIDAVMRFAAYFALMPAGTSRLDLSLAEALDHLSANHAERFDRIVIAPNVDRTAAPRHLLAVIRAALLHSDALVLLLPSEARLHLPAGLVTKVTVLHGPPFLAPVLQLPDVPVVTTHSAPERLRTTKDALRTPPLWKRLTAAGRASGGARNRREPPLQQSAPKLPAHLHAIMVLPVCGGVGGTVLAVNLAVELARARPANRVCLIDLNLQFGNVVTYSGLPVNSRIIDAYRGIDKLDADAFEMCLQQLGTNLQVFSGPAEVLPLDGIGAAQLRRILDLARARADLVIVDLPHQILDWSEAAFAEASVILALATLDLRSVKNMMKIRAMMRTEGLSDERLLLMLNRAPARPSTRWEEALQQFENSNEAAFFRILPEGGEEVAMACNAGVPLAQHAPGNALRVAIHALAADILVQTSIPLRSRLEAG